MIEIVRHATFNECLSAYFNGEIPTDGYWEWQDADGTPHRIRMGTAIKRARRRKVWGWCEDKERIHIWVGPSASLRDVVGLIAHERGHIERPWRTDSGTEERKANKYRDVAVFALDAAIDILKRAEE